MDKKEKKPILSITAKDCRWDYYVGSGKGGQKRNKTANCVRCTHIESEAVGKSEDGRSQLHNKQAAFRRMAESEKFKLWLKFQVSKILGIEKQIQEDVDRAMLPKNLKVEIHTEDGLWREALPGEIKEEEVKLTP